MAKETVKMPVCKALNDFINCSDTEVLVEGGIANIPRGTGNEPQYLILKTLNFGTEMLRGTAPELGSIGRNGF